MESVEELCDFIALLDKGRKVLDGKLVEIQKQFKTNTFEVGIEAMNKETLLGDLKARFVVEPAFFKSIHDDLKLNIRLQKHESTSELLEYLNGKAVINHYKELIPTASDIFIKAVNDNE